MSTTVSPPLSRKVIAAAVGAAIATAIQAVIPGYNPDPLVQDVIVTAVAAVSGYAYREEVKYLVPALQAAQDYVNSHQP